MPAATAPAKAEPLKAAFVYVGPVGDAGWSFSHDLGRQNALAKFGDKVTTTHVEKVPEGPDAERVIRDLVTQGNKVVFATSFGFMDAMVKVAKDHSGRLLRARDGLQDHGEPPRLRGALYEGAASPASSRARRGRRTRSASSLRSHPRGVPEHQRVHARRAERQPEGEDAGGLDQPLVRSAEGDRSRTVALNQGADVLLQNTDSTAVLQAAERNGKFAFGWDSDMSAFAPKRTWAGRAELDRLLREVVRRDPREDLEA